MTTWRRLLLAVAVAGAVTSCSLLFSTKDFDTGALVDASSESAAPGPYRAVVLGDNPVVYWRLGEKPGETAALDEADSGLNPPYASTDGGCTLGVDGAIANDPNTAVHFGSASCSLTVGSDLFRFEGTAPFSIEAWIHPETKDPARHYFVFHERNVLGDAGPTLNGYGLYVKGGQVNFERTVNGDAPIVQGTFQADGFTHVLATYDGTQLNLFINGVSTQSEPDSRALDASAIGVTTTIGLDPLGGAHFVGTLDEVAIYAFALDGGSVLAHYHAGIGK